METLSPSLKAFYNQIKLLVDRERAAECEENKLLTSECPPNVLEEAGLSIGNLMCSSRTFGLAGRILIALEGMPGSSQARSFGSHTFRAGDLARLTDSSNKSVKPAASDSSSKRRGIKKKQNAGNEEDESDGENQAEGVVYKVHDNKITIAVDAGPDVDFPEDIEIPMPCRIIKGAVLSTFDRMQEAMDNVMQKALKNELAPLHSILLCQSPLPKQEPLKDSIEYFDLNLNDSQKQSVEFSLKPSTIVGLIHGPPGTGKTSTLVEIIRQFHRQSKSILVCGASNLSVDNLLERFSQCKDLTGYTRIGHPARVQQHLLRHTLDFQATGTDSFQLVRDIEKEIDENVAKLKDRMPFAERKKTKEELKNLRKELKNRRGRVEGDVLGVCSIVLSTCTAAGGKQLKNREFDVVIIDEATQAVESACWIPILKGQKLILAGDHLQLPPTVKSGKDGSQLIKALKRAADKTEPKTVSSSPQTSDNDTDDNVANDLDSPIGENDAPTSQPSTNSGESRVKNVKKDKSSKNNKSLEIKKEETVTEISKEEKNEEAGGMDDLVSKLHHINVSHSVSTSQSQHHYRGGDDTPILKPPKNLEYTLFDRLLSLYKSSSIKRMLRIQYRMNSKIMEFPSKVMYANKISGHSSVIGRKLSDTLSEKDKNKLTQDQIDELNEPVVFFDTAGQDALESTVQDANKMMLLGSKSNIHEVQIVKNHVKTLVEAGVEQSSIAVISPYRAQVIQITDNLQNIYPDVQVGSVDGFQGQERDVVIVSLVRCNENNKIGFLKDKRRINVAMTRPRMHLAIIGNSTTISNGRSKYLMKWMNWLEENSDVRLTGLE